MRTREMRRIASVAAGRPSIDVLGEARAGALLAGAVRRQHPRGSLVVERGRSPVGFVLVVSGSVKLVGLRAQREVILDLRGPGEPACGLDALDGARPCASAVALEPVESATVSRHAIAAASAADPSVAMALVQLAAAQLAVEQYARVQDAALDTTGRVAARLVELAERFGAPRGRGAEVAVSLTQEELASWAAASHKALTTSLRRLREMGYVETGRRSIVVCDIEGLRALTR